MRRLLAVVLLCAGSLIARADDVPQLTIRPDAAVAVPLLRGVIALHDGDISGARRLLEKPATNGVPLAAHLLGQSYDPVWLTKHGVVGVGWLADVELSLDWYRRAYEMGDRSPGNWYADAHEQTDLELRRK